MTNLNYVNCLRARKLVTSYLSALFDMTVGVRLTDINEIRKFIYDAGYEIIKRNGFEKILDLKVDVEGNSLSIFVDIINV